MALSNYTELKAAVASWIVRTDLTTQIPDFISLYEADANRRIRIRQNMTTAQLSLVAGTASVALPNDFLEDVELNYDDTAEALSRSSFDLIDRYQTTDSSASRPALYAITGSTITFETEADATYTLNLRYYKKWNIAVDTTNWLLSNAPDAYLFGSVAEAAMYLHDDRLLQVGISRRDAATDWVLKADSRTKSSPLVVDAALRSAGAFDWRTG
jgi:hypothetical protein